jgi:hypothetical protein
VDLKTYNACCSGGPGSIPGQTYDRSGNGVSFCNPEVGKTFLSTAMQQKQSCISKTTYHVSFHIRVKHVTEHMGQKSMYESGSIKYKLTQRRTTTYNSEKVLKKEYRRRRRFEALMSSLPRLLSRPQNTGTCLLLLLKKRASFFTLVL